MKSSKEIQESIRKFMANYPHSISKEEADELRAKVTKRIYSKKFKRFY